MAALLAIAVTTTACGSSNEADTDRQDGPTAAADETSSGGETSGGTDDAAGGDGSAEAVVTLDGVTYEFAAGPSSCGDVSGGLIAALPLTRIDQSPAPEDAGLLSLTLYPEGLEDQSQITIDLPDDRFGAGYNEIGREWPAVTVERDGLAVTGDQRLVTLSGQESLATVQVECR
ncbi:hypothetical protein HMPREF0063_10431 [Aeromicrobium marinum DSM 15272]|uniref:Uncharacterized protein n=1 Tax=Aeromicrobium marinum DSM 15272 TaxID=585531 RepID=E2S8S4_9ACTN|nr:hypothetical protein HMPREF0063_10431 [Aeromicrobium marinum DSM 15272]